jgi:CDGSH iron-sulfur domain-containing protein 3
MPDTPPGTTPPVTIRWKPTGPYVVEGPVVFTDNEGTELVPPPAKIPGQIKLCGCGRSNTKPFCDGSHKTQCE